MDKNKNSIKIALKKKKEKNPPKKTHKTSQSPILPCSPTCSYIWWWGSFTEEKIIVDRKEI